MKLTIKSIKQQAYEVEIDSNESTIKDLKLAVETKHGFDHSTLKLLFKGVLLDDSKTVKDYSINEGDNLVMMSMKAKIVNVKKEEEVKKETASEKPTENPQSKSGTTQSTSQPSTNPQPKAEKDFTNEVNQLVEMGYPMSEAKNAIKAARGNLTLAIEFLYNGIPENIPEEEIEEGENSPNKILKTIAAIIKISCAQNPSALAGIMSTLQQTQPDIFALIQQNEEEFRGLISQPVTQEDISIFQSFQQRGGVHMGGSGAGSTSQNQNPAGNRNQIRLTQEEMEAVKRLKEFGFSEVECVQALFAFDKNEELALNFLLDSKQQEFGGFDNFAGQNNQGEKKNEDDKK